MDDALERFPEPSAVALVVGAVQFINRDNVDWDPEPTDLDVWNGAVALRALARLPRAPHLHDHLALVRRGVLGGWWSLRPAAGTDDDRDVGRDLTVVADFVRRLLDDEDRLWRPLPLPRHDGRYVPVRRTDPRWMVTGTPDTPADEDAFLAYEERWYERVLHDDEWRLLRDVQAQWRLPDVVEAFAARFPAGSPADAAYRERMPAEAPGLPWIALLDAARRQAAQMPMRSAPGKVSFWVAAERSSIAPTSGDVGHDLALEVRVLNLTRAPTVIPLSRARAAIVFGRAEHDDDLLPPPRAPRAAELVTVAPGEVASFRLSLPMRRAGLARVVVALDNDVATVGDHAEVWTGTERFVWYVAVRPVSDGSYSYRLLKEARESAARPESVDRLCGEVAALAQGRPDDRVVRPLSRVALDATDARVAHAALAALEAVVAIGGGVDAYGAFAPIAADRGRPRELRLRAVDGLARLASGRLTSRTDVSPEVRDVWDLPVPPRVVDHVRARLGELADDTDVLVAERARAALGP